MRSKNSIPSEPLPPFGALPQGGLGVSGGLGGPGGPDGSGAAGVPVERNRRVLWWLLGSLPFIAVAFVLGVALVGLHLWSWSSLRGFERGDLDAAQASYQRQVTVTSMGPSPWVALYNLGSIQIRNGQVTAGLENLESAFESVPKAIPAEDGSLQTFTYECRVRLNLAVGWESVGDQQREDDDLETAIATYDRALGWSSPCQGASDSSQLEQEGEGEGGEGGEGEGGESDQPDEGSSTSERIDQKRQQTERELNGNSAEEPQDSQDQQQNPDQSESDQDQSHKSEDPFSSETEEERERREELEQKNRQQQESQRERGESTTRNPGSTGW